MVSDTRGVESPVARGGTRLGSTLTVEAKHCKAYAAMWRASHVGFAGNRPGHALSRRAEALATATGRAPVGSGGVPDVASASRRAPRPVSTAAALTVVEGVALLAVCGAYLVRILTGKPGDRASALLGAAMGFGLALLLPVLARGLARLRRPALTPVVLVNLLGLPVGVGLLQGRVYLAGGIVLALSLGVLVSLFGSREAREAFR